VGSQRLVIGYGNPLRADDGLGGIVARRLADEAPAGDLRAIAAHQLTPELAESIGRSGLVVFVDACNDVQPGRVVTRVVETATSPSPTFSHDLDPPALLALARSLYGASPTAVVISVGGADFGYGTVLSPTVQAALPEVLRQVRVVLATGVAALDARAEQGERPFGRRAPACTR
jgi:hydrogenase maturation protease